MNQAIETVDFNSSEMWDSLGSELKGQTVLEKPRVSKKVMVKAIRMQAAAMKSMSQEFAYMTRQVVSMEKEFGGMRALNENLQRRTMDLEKSLDFANASIEVLQEKVAVSAKKITRIEYLEALINENKHELVMLKEMRVAQENSHQNFVQKIENDLVEINQRHSDLHAYTESLEEQMNGEKEELTISSTKVFVTEELTLDQKIRCMEEEGSLRENGIKESETRLLEQSNNLRELLAESRRTMEQNTVKVERVQRELLDKADRASVDDVIESKYEEIIAHLQKALASINDDEDEFKKVSRDLQELVHNLSNTKADKKELLEVKEQVLYDSRVRQQIENLRTFIDLKMNREEVMSELEEKADKQEMKAMLKKLSDSMGASVSKSIQNQLLNQTVKQNPFNGREMGDPLPSLDKSRCLTCDSPIQPKSAAISSRNPHPISQSYGGGFLLSLPQQRPTQLQSLSVEASLPSENSLLLGVDGNIYHGDLAQPRKSPMKSKNRSNMIRPLGDKQHNN